jgi:hypothetical protein
MNEDARRLRRWTGLCDRWRQGRLKVKSAQEPQKFRIAYLPPKLIQRALLAGKVSGSEVGSVPVVEGDQLANGSVPRFIKATGIHALGEKAISEEPNKPNDESSSEDRDNSLTDLQQSILSDQ